jgi:hypothetical protein
MGLKVIDSFDTHFTLAPEAEAQLFALLKEPSFSQQVCGQKGWDQAEFTGLLFQPVPYSSSTPKGMAAEFEPYQEQPERFAIVHVPPPFMFQAKIFRPSRLCAIFQQATQNAMAQNATA